MSSDSSKPRNGGEQFSYISPDGDGYTSNGPAARKIIQIAIAGHDNNQFTQSTYTMLALCDDGTVWFTTDAHRDKYGWLAMPKIPQGVHDPNDRTPLHGKERP